MGDCCARHCDEPLMTNVRLLFCGHSKSSQDALGPAFQPPLDHHALLLNALRLDSAPAPASASTRPRTTPPWRSGLAIDSPPAPTAALRRPCRVVSTQASARNKPSPRPSLHLCQPRSRSPAGIALVDDPGQPRACTIWRLPRNRA